MKKCIASSIFILNNDIKKYHDTYLSIPETLMEYKKTNEFLRDFDFVLYYDETIPDNYLDNYRKFDFVKLIKKEKSYNRSGCFWRYEAYDNYDFCFFRDIDLPLELNDILILKDVQKHEHKIFWIFAFHWRHKWPEQGFVLGGICGIKKTDKIPSMKKLIDDWNKEYKEGLQIYGSDEVFLSTVIYPLERPICYYEKNRKLVSSTIQMNPEFETYVFLNENYDFKKYTNNIQ
jgi:hypothetical protein